jgi:hypothetical protein
LRAVRLFASRIADAIVEGNQIATEGGVVSAEPDGSEGGASGAGETAAAEFAPTGEAVNSEEARSESTTAETEEARDESPESVVAAS